MEDITLLKAITAVGSPCQPSAVKRVLQMDCPWALPHALRVEVDKTSLGGKKTETRSALVAVAASSDGGGGAEASVAVPKSPLDMALVFLGTLLTQMGEDTALQHLKVLTSSLEVVKGTKSRACGGFEYEPTFIFDAVMLSDRLKVLEDMPAVVNELLG